MCLCAFSFVHVLVCAFCFFYVFKYTFVHMYTCICVQTRKRMTVDFTARFYYPTFLRQTNGLEPNAEHSSALESASYVGGGSDYRDRSGGSVATDPQNDHRAALVALFSHNNNRCFARMRPIRATHRTEWVSIESARETGRKTDIDYPQCHETR